MPRRASAGRATAVAHSGGRVGRRQLGGGGIFHGESVPAEWLVLTNPVDVSPPRSFGMRNPLLAVKTVCTVSGLRKQTAPPTAGR